MGQLSLPYHTIHYPLSKRAIDLHVMKLLTIASLVVYSE